MNASDAAKYAELGIDTSKPMSARDALGLLGSAFVFFEEAAGLHPADTEVQWAKQVGQRLFGEHGINSAMDAKRMSRTSDDPLRKALKFAMELNTNV